MTREQFITRVNEEQEALRRFLTALCLGDRDEADDIAQETLIKAYLSSDTYREQGTFAAWLYKIAHRTFLDHRKSRKDTRPIEEARHVADTSSEADHAFRYQVLYAALAALPPKERTAILLFYLKGYSVKEVAHIVDSTPEAVKKQLERGRTHLKEKIHGTR